MQLVRSKQPAVIMNNRLYRTPEAGWKNMGTEGYTPPLDPKYGDFITPEQHIPATGMPGVDWETCMTLNTTWGYSDHDHAWKSDETLIRNLIDIASKGGNYLLNIGPKATAAYPPSPSNRCRPSARMKLNGEAIYGTTASPFTSLDWGRCTRKGTTLYLHIFKWPNDGTLLVPLQNQASSTRLLADPSHTLAVSASFDGVRIRLPAKAPDAIATVIALQITGEPQVIAASPSKASER
jgi:alpha-L-fucosidase